MKMDKTKMNKEKLAQLAQELKAKSHRSLEELEQAIILARKLKTIEAEQEKINSISQDEIEQFRAVWKLTEFKQRVQIPITIVIEVAAADSDPCSIYPEILGPKILDDWDAWDLLQYFPDQRGEVVRAVEKLQKRLEAANQAYDDFKEKYDVEPNSLL